MLTRIRPGDEDVTIIVVSGTGAVTFDMLGDLKQMVFTAPSGPATFNWALTDRTGQGIDAGNNVAANLEAVVDVSDQLNGTTTLTLTNVDVNGSWPVRLRFERGI